MSQNDKKATQQIRMKANPFTGKGRCKHPHHPSAPLPPLRDRGSPPTLDTWWNLNVHYSKSPYKSLLLALLIPEMRSTKSARDMRPRFWFVRRRKETALSAASLSPTTSM